MFGMRSFVVLFLVGVVFLLAACGNSTGELRIDDQNQGQRLEIKVGQTLVVSLVSNPTTGYNWQVAENDEAILIPQGEATYQPDSKSEGLVGSGGTEIFRFSVDKSGTLNLTLVYRRPWEQGVEPLQVYTVEVVVP